MIEIKVNDKLNSFLIKLNKNNIDVLKIKGNTIYIKKKDLDRVEKLITIYDVEIIGNIFSLKKINKIFVTSIIISIIFLNILSKLIFNINIITEDPEVKKLLVKELNNHNIKRYKFQKNNLEEITKEIINNNKNIIEWLYIEKSGTTYNVKVQIREIKKEEKEKPPCNIIAKKNAVIKKLEITKGEIQKKVNQYVKKGDIIVSGEIFLNEEKKSTTESSGTVYGEVWYKINVSQPLIIYDKLETNKLNINLNFLNYSFNIIGNKESSKGKPFGLLITKQKEINTNTVLTYEEAKSLALKNTNNYILSKLNDKEHIINSHTLKESLIDSKIELVVFYTIYEDITEYKLLE